MPKPPAAILDLKVCDPACGSGSFLVGTLRYLSEALYESLLAHDWLVEDRDGRVLWGPAEPKVPDWFKELLSDVPGINEPVDRGRDARATPEGQSPPEKIRARLKRVIVERCIYGVDLDPLAVELARLALWVETMDPFLPFSFLDHKIKVGNGLVGCWFDRFQDYPALAWEREGGDKNHTTGVHFAKETWTKAIKAKRDEVKSQLGSQYDLFIKEADATATFDHALKLYEQMHAAGLRDQDKQAETYREYCDAVAVLRQAFDTWCAIWFWPADKLDLAPMPKGIEGVSPAQLEVIEELRNTVRFFHWELEFPDVFGIAPVSGAPRGRDARDTNGFSAIVGNPPWETLQPNSKEWFSNVDPLYRTYGKQEALAKQKAAFTADEDVERRWLAYNARFKEIAGWYKNVGAPFDKKQRLRRGRSFADPEHPYVHQGEGKPYTYKMFLEVAHALLHHGGRVGLIVPSGIYTDRGSTDLRTLFLERCRWDWLFGFENRDKIFEIDSRFKFCPVIIEKGGRTESIRAAFMVRDLEAWEEAERHVIDYPADRIAQFSPKSKAILEIRSDKDLAILKKMYANGVLLGNDGPDGWGIQYAQGDFNMTSDSKLFPPRPQWEAKGYVADEYGHWLKGKWRQLGTMGVSPMLHGRDARDTIRSRDGMQVIDVEDVEDVALPLYEGRMIGQFDFSQKGWVSGKGRTAVWREIGFEKKVIEPQFLMGIETYDEERPDRMGFKVGYMDVTSGTNQRTTYTTPLPDLPCGNRVNLFRPIRPVNAVLLLSSSLNALAYDYGMRQRLGGIIINYFIIDETAIPRPSRFDCFDTPSRVGLAALALTGTSPIFAPAWLSLLDSLDPAARAALLATPWRKLWAVTPHERLRLRCILDAVVAHLYGLDEEDFRWILRDCDHPVDQVNNKAFARALDPKGFWRVDKTLDPELRHTVLAQVAFADLQAMIRDHGTAGVPPAMAEEQALAKFLGGPSKDAGETPAIPNDGWMLPETLRLADYNLGHDARAQQPQPVAAALGPRFYDWQLTQSAEESWAECRMHAEKIRRIRQVGVARGSSPAKNKPRRRRDARDTQKEELFEGGA